MRKNEKENVVTDLHDKFDKAVALVVTDFSGMNVESVNQLRRKMREANTDYVVAKNTLAKLAIGDTSFAQIKDHLKGVSAFGLSYDDPVSLAKVFEDYRKLDENLVVKFGFLARGETFLSEKDVTELSKVPSREVLLSRLARAMMSQHSGLVYALHGVLSKFVRTVDAVRAKKAESEQ